MADTATVKDTGPQSVRKARDKTRDNLRIKDHWTSLTRIISLVLIFFILLTIFPSIVHAVPKCTVSSDGVSPCSSAQEWKENLLCRIQGPIDESGSRSGGYVGDSIPKMDDNIATVKRKLWAQRVYATLSTVLNSEAVFSTPYIPIRTLIMYEKMVSQVGLAMYGVNWIMSPKLCGLNGKAFVSCGDKGGSLTPTDCG